MKLGAHWRLSQLIANNLKPRLMAQKIIDFDAYRNYFNDPGLWDKLKKVAVKPALRSYIRRWCSIT